MTTRYYDAATVSDEHGKGVEILRQNSAAHTGSDDSIPIMVAEVDLVIRNLKVAGNEVDPAAGTVQFFSRPPGGTAVPLTASTAVSSMAANDVLDIPLSAANTTVKKGDMIQVTIASLTSNVRLTAIVGWMPDMFTLEAQARSYSLPG